MAALDAAPPDALEGAAALDAFDAALDVDGDGGDGEESEPWPELADVGPATKTLILRKRAAFAAHRFVDAALGTQTIGSIGRPAAFCGVAALAPTRGRVPRDGVELYSPSVDVVGAFAKDCNTLRDVSRLIYDDWEEPDPDGGVLPRKKLVVLETFRDAVCTTEAKSNFAQALAYLRDAGFEGTVCAMPTPLLDDFASLARRHRCLVNSELQQGHAKRFADHGPLYRPETAALLRASYDPVNPGSMEALREELRGKEARRMAGTR